MWQKKIVNCKCNIVCVERAPFEIRYTYLNMAISGAHNATIPWTSKYNVIQMRWKWSDIGTRKDTMMKNKHDFFSWRWTDAAAVAKFRNATTHLRFHLITSHHHKKNEAKKKKKERRLPASPKRSHDSDPIPRRKQTAAESFETKEKRSEKKIEEEKLRNRKKNWEYLWRLESSHWNFYRTGLLASHAREKNKVSRKTEWKKTNLFSNFSFMTFEASGSNATHYKIKRRPHNRLPRQ